jgi:hypothetical protein
LRARIVVREILDQHWSVCAHEQPQRRLDHPFLKCPVTRRAKWPPQLERDPQRPRRPSLLDLRSDQTDGDRRDPLILEIMPQRAHGARAERSNGREDDAVDGVLF